MKNFNPVCWFDIHVSNLNQAKKFYGSVFQVNLTDLPEEWGKQSTFPFDDKGPNSTGALVESQNGQFNGNNTIIYFASEDCTSEEERVEEAGGKIVRSKTAIGEFGYISLFKDLDGNTIGLFSRQ